MNMNTLKYKGFIGSVEIEPDDLSLYGKVLGLDKKTLISYEGHDVAELEKDFHNAIDEYILYCEENNLPIHKSYSGSFNIRIPQSLHAKASELAAERGISLNAYVRNAIEKAVQSQLV